VPIPDENSVFINIPYDKSYEHIFVSIIAALISIGRMPRCTLEIAEGGQGRLTRIHDLLESCRVSIHDLSCVKTPVRFNMPFELGLACALDRFNGPHSYILLEKKNYRLDKTLSDIKGRDPYIYGGSMLKVVQCVLDALGKKEGQPEMTRVRKLAVDLWQIAKEIKKNNKVETIFNRTSYYRLISVGVEYAVKRGFIPESNGGNSS